MTIIQVLIIKMRIARGSEQKMQSQLDIVHTLQKYASSRTGAHSDRWRTRQRHQCASTRHAHHHPHAHPHRRHRTALHRTAPHCHTPTLTLTLTLTPTPKRKQLLTRSHCYTYRMFQKTIYVRNSKPKFMEMWI